MFWFDGNGHDIHDCTFLVQFILGLFIHCTDDVLLELNHTGNVGGSAHIFLVEVFWFIMEIFNHAYSY